MAAVTTAHTSHKAQISSEMTNRPSLIITERRRRVVNTLASYSGGPEFKSRPGDSYPDRDFVVFLSLSG
jgi:hypothetical protein